MQSHSANVVFLTGWLSVQEVRSIAMKEAQKIALRGWVHTKKPTHITAQPNDSSFPVLLAGDPAGIVLDRARNRPQEPLWVVIEGRLLRKGEDLTVLVKFVSVLDAVTRPLV